MGSSRRDNDGFRLKIAAVGFYGLGFSVNNGKNFACLKISPLKKSLIDELFGKFISGNGS